MRFGRSRHPHPLSRHRRLQDYQTIKDRLWRIGRSLAHGASIFIRRQVEPTKLSSLLGDSWSLSYPRPISLAMKLKATDDMVQLSRYPDRKKYPITPVWLVGVATVKPKHRDSQPGWRGWYRLPVSAVLYKNGAVHLQVVLMNYFKKPLFQRAG